MLRRRIPSFRPATCGPGDGSAPGEAGLMSGGTRRSPRANEPRPAIESLRVGKQEGVNTQLLSIYLNDHLAGAIAGTELARRALHNNRQTPLAAGLQRIVEEIEEDRRSLESLMDRVGATRNPLKAVAAW